MRVAQWAMPPATALMCLRSYLSVVGRAWVILAVMTVGALANGVLNFALISGNFGAPRLGIVGAAWAAMGASVAMLALLLAYTATAPALRR